MRGELFQFALRLTGNPFDAEDLVHDALLRAFASMSVHYGRVREPRPYLFRILTNLWIDQTRKAHPIVGLGEIPDTEDTGVVAADDALDIRDATDTLFVVLPPRERAVVVLKEACGFTHAEIAELLSTTEGAVKVALHRGKKRLAEQREVSRSLPSKPRVSRELVDRFVSAMRAHDVEALKAMMVENVETDTFPSGVGVGLDHHEKEGWLHGCFYHHIPWREETRTPYPIELEVREMDGEPFALVIREQKGRKVLEEVWRLEEDVGKVSRVRDYGFCPDLVRFMAEEFSMKFHAVAYRFHAVAYRFREGIYEDPSAHTNLH